MAKRNPPPTTTVDVVTASFHPEDAGVAARTLREYALGARTAALNIKTIDRKGSDHCAQMLRDADAIERVAALLSYAR